MNINLLFKKFINNWPAKILSLTLAIIIFVFHRMVTLEERFFSSPLIIENLDGMIPSSYYPRMIRVTLRGETHGIYSIMEEDIEVFIDMEDFIIPGTYRVPVQWRKKGTAIGVDPLQVSIDPAEIIFSLDTRISRLVPVIARFRGQVEPGFIMTSFSLNPNQIIIDGPAGLMGAISELPTELIDLDGRQGNFSLTSNIIIDDPLILFRGRGTTEFNGIISQVIPVQNISNLPIIITGIREDFEAELEVNTGNLHIEGENQEDLVAFVPPPDFLRVDCSGISEPGIYILRVLTGYAPNMSLRVEPAEVSIRITLAEQD
ncbi:MAG: CdaR family protein [Treponema sp.]|nr:CdaR family protein [Treponema sp.]